MHCNILFNGCSYTFGGELEGLDNDLEYRRTHRFSHLVANHFGMTYDNISIPGICNDLIVEDTIQWFREGNTCDVAIIQLTYPERTVWYDNEKKSYNIRPNIIDISKNFRMKRIVSSDQIARVSKSIEVSKKYYTSIYCDYLGCQNYYKNVFLLKTYFSLKNIPHVILSSAPPPKSDIGWNMMCNNVMIKNILGVSGIIGDKKDHPHYFCENYAEKLKFHKNYNMYLVGGHPNELGHQKIADYIIGEIK